MAPIQKAALSLYGKPFKYDHDYEKFKNLSLHTFVVLTSKQKDGVRLKEEKKGEGSGEAARPWLAPLWPSDSRPSFRGPVVDADLPGGTDQWFVEPEDNNDKPAVDVEEDNTKKGRR